MISLKIQRKKSKNLTQERKNKRTYKISYYKSTKVKQIWQLNTKSQDKAKLNKNQMMNKDKCQSHKNSPPRQINQYKKTQI